MLRGIFNLSLNEHFLYCRTFHGIKLNWTRKERKKKKLIKIKTIKENHTQAKKFCNLAEATEEGRVRVNFGSMDLSCNETMINDENEYNLYVEYQTEEKPATSAGSQDLLQQQPVQQNDMAKLYSNACTDPTFLRDRCLKNLLTSQKRYKTPSCAYFNTIQKSLTPQMRKIVAEWVIEVSFI